MSMENGTPLKRSYWAHFIDVNFGTSPSYKILGDDLENYDLTFGINTEYKTNILDKRSGKITEYARTGDVANYVCKKGDPLYDHLLESAMAQADISAFETTVIDVVLDSDGTISKAWKTEVTAIPTKIGGAGGSPLDMPFVITYTGISEKLTVANLSISDDVLTISSGSSGNT